MNRSALLASSFAILIILGSIPVMAETETETKTQASYQSTSYQYTSSNQQGSSLQFSIVSVPVPSQPNYTGGNGYASILASGTTLSIHIHVKGTARAHFTLALVANNATQAIANMTADEEGEIEAEAQATLAAGNFSLGLRIFDTSSFSVPTLVMATSPPSQRLQLPTAQPTNTQSETDGQQVNTVGGDESDDGEVRNAMQSNFIPAVVDVGPSGSSAVVSDNRFSVSVGSLQGNGIIVSVSALNVTGPRVILVNLTAPQARALFSGSVLVTLDGIAIQQSSSVSQVLGVRAGDPSMWVVYSFKSGLKLLVSIPHFSFHIIQVLPVLTEIGSAVLDFTFVILSVAAVSAVILISYTGRTKFDG
jgi:hypothetical protein